MNFTLTGKIKFFEIFFAQINGAADKVLRRKNIRIFFNELSFSFYVVVKI